MRKRSPSPLARLAWKFLVARGWLWQINTPERCHHEVADGDRVLNVGWRPYYSVRYGHTPVFIADIRLREDAPA